MNGDPKENTGLENGPVAALWTLAILLIPVVAVLAKPLLLGHRLAYRDVSFFYTPLYRYVADRTGRNDWFPYWNPLDGWTDGQFGKPLCGETTTAVFYPVRWLFQAWSDVCLGGSAGMWITGYAMLHVAIAAGTMFGFAVALQRSSRTRKENLFRAAMGSVVYSLSGGVFGLCNNTVFGVSAAWIPLSLLIALSWFRGSSVALRTVLASGGAIGLMILGGDPQTALHAAMVLTVSAAWTITTGRTKPGAALSQLGGCLLVAAWVALPQIAESIDYLSGTNRTALIGEAERMRFAISPWRLAELLTPLAWGKLVPHHASLSPSIDQPWQLWTPTIYCGGVSILCFATAIARRRLRRWVWPWIVLAVIALELSMGDRGLIGSIAGVFGGDPRWHGLYGWLCRIVPGYGSFRYPPKWMPWVSVAVASIVTMTAGKFATRQRLRHWFGLAGVLLVFAGLHGLHCLWLSPRPAAADEFWGPVDTAGAMRWIGGSLLASAVILPVLWVCSGHRRLWWAITAAELAVVSVITLPTVPDTLVVRDRRRPGDPVDRLLRISLPDQWPADWRETHDPDRLQIVERQCRAIRFGRWHLSDHVGMLNSMSSIGSSKLSREFADLRRRQAETPQRSDELIGEFAIRHRCNGLWRERGSHSDDQSLTPDLIRYRPPMPIGAMPSRPWYLQLCIAVWLITMSLGGLVLGRRRVRRRRSSR